MSYFQKISSGIAVDEALKELLASKVSVRPKWGRSCPNPEPSGVRILYPDQFGPAMLALYRQAVEMLGDEIGASSAVVRILPPRSSMKMHRDQLNVPGGVQRRYHLLLQSDPTSWFLIGGERAHLQTGELWRTDIGNRRHKVANPGDRARITMLIDAMDKGHDGNLIYFEGGVEMHAEALPVNDDRAGIQFPWEWRPEPIVAIAGSKSGL